ncbi:MAG: hypothetical protein U0263_38215 [Polyangiaceae bacterium]
MTALVLRRFCERCGAYREPHQIRMVGPQASAVPMCATCGGALRTEHQRQAAPFGSELARAFVFPFLPAIALSTIGAAVGSAIVSFVPLIGNPLSSTIIVAFFFLVVRATAEGRDDLASDTEIAGNVWLWFSPLIRYFLTLLVAFTPALAALVFLGWTASAPLVLALALLGLLYLPAGIIVAAHNEGCIAPLNPVPAVQIIFRIPGAYFLTLVFLLLAATLGGAVVYGASLVLGSIPILGALVLRVIGLYAPVVMGRQLGLLMREHGEEL